MDVKEAIEWINEIWHDWENIFGSSAEGNLESGREKDEVINLLKRGEKFEQMWEEFKLINREYFGNFEIRANYIIRMEELKQKYFPKEGEPK